MSDKIPIRAVLFDCDGTLIDTIPLHRKINSLLTKKMGIATSMTWFPDHPTHYFSQLGWSKKKILDFWESFYDREARGKPGIFPGINELLTKLRADGIMSIVVTNRHFHKNFFNLLNNTGLDCANVDLFINYFHPITASQGTGARPLNSLLAQYPKPDPRVLDVVIGQLKTLPGYPESVLVVGDSVNLDYALAQRMNFKFIGVESGTDGRGNFLKVIDRKFIIKNVGELINMLQ